VCFDNAFAGITINYILGREIVISIKNYSKRVACFALLKFGESYFTDFTELSKLDVTTQKET